MYLRETSLEKSLCQKYPKCQSSKTGIKNTKNFETYPREKDNHKNCMSKNLWVEKKFVIYLREIVWKNLFEKFPETSKLKNLGRMTLEQWIMNRINEHSMILWIHYEQIRYFERSKIILFLLILEQCTHKFQSLIFLYKWTFSALLESIFE